MTTTSLLKQAIAKAKAGKRTKARDLFMAILEEDEENELAWLWLSSLVDDVEDKIIALENALTINPDNKVAQKQLTRWQAEQIAPTPPLLETLASFAYAGTQLDAALINAKDPFALGQQYEEEGKLDKARIAYQSAIVNAPLANQRQAAQERLKTVERQSELSSPIPIHSTFTLVRLASGPIVFLHPIAHLTIRIFILYM